MPEPPTASLLGLLGLILLRVEFHRREVELTHRDTRCCNACTETGTRFSDQAPWR